MRRGPWIVCLGVLSLASGTLRCQSTDDINSALQFNFSNPGARSLAMAGAFTARADDATAVYANPAGLIQLARPEIAVEGRGWQYMNPFLNGGDESLAGMDPFIIEETNDSVAGLSFLSYMHPFKSGRWVVGAFKHSLVNFETEIHSDGAVAQDTNEIRPLDGFYDLELDSYGVSFSGEFGSFSVGATVTSTDFELRSRTERLDALRNVEDPSKGLFSADEGTNPFIVENDGTDADPRRICCTFADRGDVRFFETQTGSDDDVHFTIGALWRSKQGRLGLAPRFAVAAVYRQGGEFDFEGASFERGLTQTGPATLVRFFEPVTAAAAGQAPWPGVFNVPDILGFGLAASPSDTWVVALDWNRVNYSDLTEELLDITNVTGGTNQGRLVRGSEFELEDGDEVRLGVQHAILSESRGADVFIRGGAWLDPEHIVRYTGPEPAFRAVFRGGDDELHYSGGMGIRLPRFQLDFGADLSQRVNTFSLATVFFLGES